MAEFWQNFHRLLRKNHRKTLIFIKITDLKKKSEKKFLGYFFLLPPMEPLHKKIIVFFYDLVYCAFSTWNTDLDLDPFFILYQVGVEGAICQQLPTIINNLRVNESLYFRNSRHKCPT